MEIDNALNSGFVGGSRAAVIHHLERLHGVSAMMFHAYCDNENASFRRVAIIFTLHTDAESESGQESGKAVEEERSRRETDRHVESLLRRYWQDHIDTDKFEPLMSRIGNSNVFVRRETDEALTAIGC